MNIVAFKGPLFAAYQCGDLDRCLALLDGFCADAGGEELGWALARKADILALIGGGRALEGLTYTEQALPLLQGNPGAAMRALIPALQLCLTLGDLERSRLYEALSHQLLQTHGDHPDVREGAFRLHLHMGRIAAEREEYPAAYWHFMRGIVLVEERGSDDGSDPQSWLFRFHLHTASVCLHMGRMPAAERALEAASDCMTQDAERLQWAMGRADVLRHTGDAARAAILLDVLMAETEGADWCPENRVDWLLSRALVAREMGDAGAWRQCLDAATGEAVGHALYLPLLQIGRLRRIPEGQGVANRHR